jgi:hypothetical protein
MTMLLNKELIVFHRKQGAWRSLYVELDFTEPEAMIAIKLPHIIPRPGEELSALKLQTTKFFSRKPHNCREKPHQSSLDWGRQFLQ